MVTENNTTNKGRKQLLEALKRGEANMRATRFDVRDYKVEAIARHHNMRFNCYWLQALEVSGTGLSLVQKGDSFVTFHPGDIVIITFDIATVLFCRPIHMTAEIKRVWETENGVMNFGLFLKRIDPNHEEVFFEGLEKLGDPYSLENTRGQKEADLNYL